MTTAPLQVMQSVPELTEEDTVPVPVESPAGACSQTQAWVGGGRLCPRQQRVGRDPQFSFTTSSPPPVRNALKVCRTLYNTSRALGLWWVPLKHDMQYAATPSKFPSDPPRHQLATSRTE